jgi:hypothetical protein
MRVTAVGWNIEHALATLDSVVESVSDTEARLCYRYLAQTLVGPKYPCVVVKVRNEAAARPLCRQIRSGRIRNGLRSLRR